MLDKECGWSLPGSTILLQYYGYGKSWVDQYSYF